MASIRLYQSQIEYLRRRAGAVTLRSALNRYRSGNIVTEKRDFEKKHEKLLPYSLHSPITDLTPDCVRAVLFAAMRNPVDHRQEIRTLGEEIAAIFSAFENKQYITENWE